MERKLTYSKSLQIDEKFLKSIENIYKIIDENPSVTLITKDNAKYELYTLEGLLSYDFSEDVKTLIIENSDLKNNILFIFEVIPHRLFNYKYTVICKYTIEDNNIDNILKDKILKLLSNNTKSDWFLGKYGIIFICLIILLMLLIIFATIECIKNFTILNQPTSLLSLLGFFLGIFISFLTKPLDKIISDKFFKPIVYYLGYQKTKWDKTLKLRENIFWVIIIGIIVSIFATFITNKIF